MENHYQHIRSATGKLYYAGEVFLIDPLLAKKGVYPGFQMIKLFLLKIIDTQQMKF